MGRALGTSIKSLRTAQQVTQAELAKAVGVSVQAVSKWECGGTPDVELLPRIADFFDVTIDQLFGRDSSGSASISHLVTNAMEHTPRHEKMQKASDICWAVFKGLTNIPNISSSGLADGADSVDVECTRGRVASNEGTAYVCADPKRFSFFIMADPEEGYASLLLSPEKFADVFSFLGNREAMEVLMYLCRRRACPFSMPFSIEHICKTLNISRENMQKYLKRCIEFGWLRNERAELVEGQITLYSSCLTEAALAFLYYAAEFTRNFNMWHMSSTSQREKPIIT